jgi:hypothetical protein
MKLKNLFGIMVIAALSAVVFNACKDKDKDEPDARDAYVGTYEVQVQAIIGEVTVADVAVDLNLSKKDNDKFLAATNFNLSAMGQTIPVSVSLILSSVKEVENGYQFKIEKQSGVTTMPTVELEGTKDGSISKVGEDTIIDFEVQGEITNMGTMTIKVNGKLKK